MRLFSSVMILSVLTTGPVYGHSFGEGFRVTPKDIAPFVALAAVFGQAFGDGNYNVMQDLPPRILADKYLMQAEQLLEKKEFDGALKFVERIIALRKKHGFALRDEFHYKHARIAYAAGRIPTAITAASAYLSSGSEGEFYKDAMALLIKAQELEFTPDKTCTGKSEGGGCWMALANHPDCYVWNPYPVKDETVTWTGGCAGNVANGEGTLTWAVSDGDSNKVTSTNTGRLHYGRFDGHWVLRFPDGPDHEGPFVDGKANGHWILRHSDGRVSEGPFVSGSRNGHWVEHYLNGYVGKGPYVDGKQNGYWVVRKNNSYKSKVRFVVGKQEGSYLRFRPDRPTGERCKSATYRNGDRVTEWNVVNESMCDF